MLPNRQYSKTIKQILHPLGFCQHEKSIGQRRLTIANSKFQIVWSSFLDDGAGKSKWGNLNVACFKAVYSYRKSIRESKLRAIHKPFHSLR